MTEDNFDIDLEEGPSKSQIKREMIALFELGEKLSLLSDVKLAKCNLPEQLVYSIEELQRIPANKHGARKRHFQFIGKLMRDLNEDQLKLIDEQLHNNVELDKKRFADLELQRDKLLAGDKAALDDLIEANPNLNIQQLRQLIRQSQKELKTDQGSPASKKLFRFLRDLQEAEQS